MCPSNCASISGPTLETHLELCALSPRLWLLPMPISLSSSLETTDVSQRRFPTPNRESFVFGTKMIDAALGPGPIFRQFDCAMWLSTPRLALETFDCANVNGINTCNSNLLINTSILLSSRYRFPLSASTLARVPSRLPKQRLDMSYSASTALAMPNGGERRR